MAGEQTPRQGENSRQNEIGQNDGARNEAARNESGRNEPSRAESVSQNYTLTAVARHLDISVDSLQRLRRPLPTILGQMPRLPNLSSPAPMLPR